MTDWVAVSVDLADDPKVIAFGKDLGVSTDTAAMSLVRLWGRMARHEMETGDLSEVDDTTLEEWARWRGKRGRFAAGFRERFTVGGVVNGWWAWNGRHLRRARLDRDAKRRARGYDEPPDNPRNFGGPSADGPPKSPRHSDAYTGTGTKPTTNPTQPRSGFASLLDKLPDTGGTRWAVTEFLEHVPGGRADAWTPILANCLQGLDLPGGRPCSVEQLATTCRDFMTKPEHEWTPKFFRTCVAALMREPTGAPPPPRRKSGRSAKEIAEQMERDERGAA
jgi:hypothetical protein